MPTKSKRKADAPLTAREVPLNDYGVPLSVAKLGQLCIEKWCWWRDWDTQKGGLGSLEHFRRACACLWPPDTFIWDPWLNVKIDSLSSRDYETVTGSVRTRVIAWTGCASAGKTFAAGLFALNWWLVSKDTSVVILTSTSKASIRRRVWPVIQHLWHSMRDYIDDEPYRVGNLVDSETKLQSKKGNDKHAIFAQAVESGEIQKAVDRIKGQHAPRMMLVIDEANSAPKAIFECIPNARKGCNEFVLLVIGNAVSRLDLHGRCCEPKAGWGSVNVDSEEWETRGVPEWQIPSGHCLHFDGFKSPNVKERKTIYPFLYTYENFLAAKGTDTANSVAFWSQDRGFWPPEGVSNTVLSEPMLIYHRAINAEPFVFHGKLVPIAGLDPAFGGNTCRLQFGMMGPDQEGKLCIQLTEAFNIKGNVLDPQPLDYQIARKVIELCTEKKVKPAGLGVDATAIGRGVYAILVHEWSPDILRVEFGGKASEAVASADDPRAGNEVYHNRVAQLWWQVREAVCGGQLRGIGIEAARQFCSREYKLLNRRYVLMPKDECMLQYGESPDEADAIAVLVESARSNGLVPGGTENPALDQNVLENLTRLDDVNIRDELQMPIAQAMDGFYE